MPHQESGVQTPGQYPQQLHNDHCRFVKPIVNRYHLLTRCPGPSDHDHFSQQHARGSRGLSWDVSVTAAAVDLCPDP